MADPGVVTAISTEAISTSTIRPDGYTYITTVTYLSPSYTVAVSTTENSIVLSGIFSTEYSTKFSTIYTFQTTTPPGIGGNTHTTSLSPNTGITPSASKTPDSTSSILPSRTQASKHGLTKAAEAGIGVGSIIAGAVFIFLGACLFFRLRKRRQSQTRSSDFNRESGGRIESLPPTNNLEKNSNHVTHTPLDSVTIDRADDSQIRNAMRDLNEFIYQHVENHYHTRQLSSRPDDLEQGLLELGYTDRSTLPTNTMVSLLTSSKTRKIAIRRLIASVMVENVLSKSDPNSSLLDPKLHGAIAQSLSHLNAVLTSFVRTGSESQSRQKENLFSILKEGAKFGILLSSQPMEWTFGWDERRGDQRDGRSRMVVFPSIGEVRESGGRRTTRWVVEVVEEI